MDQFQLFALLTKSVLGEKYAEIVCDALQCYGNHSEWFCSDDEFKEVVRLVRGFDSVGLNSMIAEFDVLRKVS